MRHDVLRLAPPIFGALGLTLLLGFDLAEGLLPWVVATGFGLILSLVWLPVLTRIEKRADDDH